MTSHSFLQVIVAIAHLLEPQLRGNDTSLTEVMSIVRFTAHYDLL